jgi:hypothetical protein
VACGVWRVACGVWRVACGVWRVACGVWRVACDSTPKGVEIKKEIKRERIRTVIHLAMNGSRLPALADVMPVIS